MSFYEILLSVSLVHAVGAAIFVGVGFVNQNVKWSNQLLFALMIISVVYMIMVVTLMEMEVSSLTDQQQSAFNLHQLTVYFGVIEYGGLLLWYNIRRFKFSSFERMLFSFVYLMALGMNGYAYLLFNQIGVL